MIVSIDELLKAAIIASINASAVLISNRYMGQAIERLEKRLKNGDKSDNASN